MSIKDELLTALIELVAASDAYDETEETEQRCIRALDCARDVIAKAAPATEGEA